MLRKIFGKKYHHLNKISVSKSALRHNHFALKKLQKNVVIAPVLKSNAYGHGIQVVAPIFDSLEPEFLVVDSLYEAYELQKLNVKSKILILGYTIPENFAVKQLPFHFTVFDIKTAKYLNTYQKKCQVHLFVDTGMNREGIPISELESFVEKIKKLTNLEIVGLASHFADADNFENQNFSQNQLLEYLEALEILRKSGIQPKYRHLSASAGTYKIFHNEINMVRAGLSSYGISPLTKIDKDFEKLELKPALTLSSTLVQIKKVNKGEKIGYNGTFTAKKNMRIGLLPLGYYEGVDRRLSNIGFVTVRGVSCPVIGRVSMNMTSIDVSKVTNCKLGDQVIVYSNCAKEKNSVQNTANLAKTISYEILVHLAESIRREVVK